LANIGFQTVYNYIGLGLEPELTVRRYAREYIGSEAAAMHFWWFEIRGNGIRWNETKHVELEQFLHAFTSRGFDNVSWAFLFL